MLRRKENLLGRQSRAQDVQGEVCLDNPSVVIDRMTDVKQVSTTPLRMTDVKQVAWSAFRAGSTTQAPSVWRVLARMTTLDAELRCGYPLPATDSADSKADLARRRRDGGQRVHGMVHAAKDVFFSNGVEQ